MREIIRTVLAWLAIGFATMLLFGVGGEWLIHVAEDKGWYKNAGANWDRGMSMISHFFEWVSSAVTSTPSLMIGSAIGGAALALRTDRFLLKEDIQIDKKSELPEVKGHIENAIASEIDVDSDGFWHSFPEKKPEKFDYPYRKAVLIADVQEPSGSVANTELVEMTATMSIKNQHSKTLENCCVRIDGFSFDTELTHVRDFIKIGGKIGVNLRKGEEKRFVLARRDFRDKISNAPFFIKLSKGNIILYENRTYLFIISLISEYDYSTRVNLEVKIGKGSEIKTRILDQSV